MTDQQLQQMLALDGGPGPALAIDAWTADEIIDAALAGAGFGPGGGGGGSSGASGGGAAVGTKLAIIGGIALVVALAIIAWPRHRRAGEHVALLADAKIDAPITGSGASAAPVAAPPVTAETTPPTVPPAPVEPTEAQPTIEPPPAERPTHTKPAHHEPAPSAADLLGEANAKRAAKQWRVSDDLYAKVVTRAPKSLAAQTALVASASLRLEHLGDPKGAVLRFRRALALAPKGAVAEDARWGLAEALRATHDAAGEAQALDDFLAHHADSPLAERAKTRRAELK